MDQFGFEDFEVSGARPGPKSGAQTPAKPSERKKGSSRIPHDSSLDTHPQQEDAESYFLMTY